MQPIDVQYPNRSALGHAIDYRLRLSLGGRLGLAVVAGVMLLDETGPLRGAPARGARKALRAADRELLATVDTYLTDPGSLEENALIRLCFVAGFFEDSPATQLSVQALSAACRSLMRVVKSAGAMRAFSTSGWSASVG
ncbi:hypothetical protein ACSNOK_09975 [Streptomyces sp. URMC 126]|uniref:hypothetical protein n=1 Tax=Streptomyces sp. URMC 126 TaxID=3423401 RepID=UPI003F19AFE0